MTTDYISFIRKLHHEYQVSETVLNEEANQLTALYDYIKQGGGLYDDSSYRSDDILGDIYDTWCDIDGKNSKDAFMEFSGILAYYSTMLAIEAPEQYIPYYYKWNFNVLQIITDTFGIDLPEIPKKADYEGRFFYFGDICAALHEFRKQNHLSPYELCAFLYDYAPKCIGGVSSYIITDLPEPHSAFFIGGSKDDLFLSDEGNTITPWQCNPETRAGDMIVMYLRTPVSAVDSIWRSCSVGFIDPFFYYYR